MTFIKSPSEGWKCSLAVMNGNPTASGTLRPPLSLPPVCGGTCCAAGTDAAGPQHWERWAGAELPARHRLLPPAASDAAAES